jgi:hypothetical protein
MKQFRANRGLGGHFPASGNRPDAAQAMRGFAGRL